MPNFLGNLFKTKSRQQKFDEAKEKRMKEYEKTGREAQIRQWEMDNGKRYYDEGGDPLELNITDKLPSSIRYGGKTRKHKKSKKSRKHKKSRKSRKSRK